MNTSGAVIQAHWAASLRFDEGTLHTTSARDLWQHFIDTVPESGRQRWNCHACRDFINAYGGVLQIREGQRRALFWQPTDALPELAAAFARLRAEVERADVVGVFRPSTRTLGQPEHTHAGTTYRHMSVVVPASIVGAAHHLPTHHEMLTRVLADNTRETVARAIELLHGLPRAEAHAAHLTWLLGVVEDSSDDRVWVAVARAYTGVISAVRSGAAAQLLEWVRDGRSESDVSMRWAQLIDATVYMRPQAAPSDGAIDEAERVFAGMGLTHQDLERHHLTELPARAVVWQATDQAGASSAAAPRVPTRVSWRGLATHIAGATRVEIQLPMAIAIFHFTTGAAGTRPLMQWHHNEGEGQPHENLASWYTAAVLTDTTSHGLHVGWNDVRAIARFPHMWDTEAPRLAEKYLVQLAVRASGSEESALFPEMMRSEFHPVRRVIEAYSRAHPIARCEHVAGVAVYRDNAAAGMVFRITKARGQRVFRISSWE